MKLPTFRAVKLKSFTVCCESETNISVFRRDLTVTDKHCIVAATATITFSCLFKQPFLDLCQVGLRCQMESLGITRTGFYGP